MPQEGLDISRAGRLFRVPVLLVLALLLLGCEGEDRFGVEGLPRDLPKYARQLRSLELPSDVSRLDWIPANLTELDVQGTNATEIPFLPSTLKSLNVRGARNLTRLPPLPPTLKDLDVSFTNIAESFWATQELDSLTLGGRSLVRLPRLNEGLLSLSLTGVENLGSTAGLPSSLEVLEISASRLNEISPLPPALKVLRLTDTNIRWLKDLPSTVQELALVETGAMEVDLPPYLLSLTVRGSYREFSSLRRLAFLNRLSIESYTGVPLSKSAGVLRLLRTADDVEVSPTFLQSLEIVGNRAVVNLSLPRGIEELSWPGASTLADIPETVRKLSIPGSPVTSLVDLPPNVVELDISGTQISLCEVPDAVEVLRYLFYSGAEVACLPKQLRSLDLSGSTRLRTLKSLPASLEHLRIRETALASLPALPRHLKTIDISGSRISELPELPGDLRSLTISAGQLATLKGLPASVTNIYFKERF